MYRTWRLWSRDTKTLWRKLSLATKQVKCREQLIWAESYNDSYHRWYLRQPWGAPCPPLRVAAAPDVWKRRKYAKFNKNIHRPLPWHLQTIQEVRDIVGGDLSLLSTNIKLSWIISHIHLYLIMLIYCLGIVKILRMPERQSPRWGRTTQRSSSARGPWATRCLSPPTFSNQYKGGWPRLIVVLI